MRRLAAVLALVLALGACSLSRPASTLTLGAVYPLSGPQAQGAREELAGFEAALALAQREGLAEASRVRLRVIDAQTPDAAVQAVDTLMAAHVPLIAGTYGSTLAVPAAARADAGQTVYWENGAVADEETAHRSYVFRTVATGSTLGRIAAQFTARVLLARDKLTAAGSRVVIVHTDDVYGQSVALGETSQARADGFKDVRQVAYDPHAYDPGGIAEQVKALAPDYLWDVSYLDDGVAIWQALEAAGVHVRAAVGTSSAFCMPDFARRVGPLAVGVYAADKPDGASVPPNALLDSGRSLLAQASAIYAARQGEPMSIPAVAGFVGGWTLFHDVLPKVRGAITPDSLRAAAYAVNVNYGQAINGGGVRFAPAGQPDAGQNRRAAAVVGEWIRGLEETQPVVMKVVYPPAYAAGG